MSSFVTRDLRITYGGYVCGADSDRQLHDYLSIREALGVGQLVFDVWLQRDDGGDFAADVAAFEAQFRKRDQRLTIENIADGTTLKDWNPTKTGGGNTAFNMRAEYDLAGTEGADTARSRLYRVTIEFELPADVEDGQRELEVEISSTAANRRRVTISGEYTADDDMDATENYEDKIAAVMSSITNSIDSEATWEYTTRNTKRDRTDKVLRFVWVWEERLANQAAATLDHPSIRDSHLSWQRASDSPGDSASGVRRLDRVVGLFTCSVDKDVTTDLKATYEDVILPFVEEAMQADFSPSHFGRELENRDFNEDENTITAVLTYLVALDATDVVASTLASRIVESGGIHMSPAWSGGIFDKYADQGHAMRQRHGIRIVEVLGVVGPKERIGKGGGGVFGVSFSGGSATSGVVANAGDLGFRGFDQPQASADVLNVTEDDSVFGNGSPAGEGLGGGTAPSMSGWLLVSNESEATRREVGIGPDKVVTTLLTERTVEEWVEDPGGGGGNIGGAQIRGANAS